MKELDNFISSLSDHELAIFIRYRSDGFLSNTKEKIDAEVKRRNLTLAQLELYANEKLNIKSEGKKKRCPRCGSERLFEESNYTEIPFTEFSSLEIISNTNRCRLCGYNSDKANPKTFRERIIRFFRKIWNKRFYRWNSW